VMADRSPGWVAVVVVVCHVVVSGISGLVS
jgi:hypothetical protein